VTFAQKATGNQIARISGPPHSSEWPERYGNGNVDDYFQILSNKFRNQKANTLNSCTCLASALAAQEAPDGNVNSCACFAISLSLALARSRSLFSHSLCLRRPQALRKFDRFLGNVEEAVECRRGSGILTPGSGVECLFTRLRSRMESNVL